MLNSNDGVIFIKWFPYDKRNEAIASSIGAHCFFVHCLKSRKLWNAPVRYILQCVKTIALLWKKKPKTVFVTNPPIFAAGTVALYCALKGASYVIDSHTGAFSNKWKFAGFLHKFLARRALLTIVTNSEFEKIYRDWGANTFILGDLVLDIPRTETLQLSKRFNIVVICSFDPDEPIEAILDAAKETPSATFYITGNLRRAPREVRETKVENIVFTGFLPDREYFALLHACDAIMVLVNRDNTMQQGAYEAVSVRKPMILSDWGILREAYGKGTVFVSNDSDSICDGVSRIRQNHPVYQEQMDSLYAERKEIWEVKCRYLRELIG